MKSSKILLGLGLFSILGALFLLMAGAFTEKLPTQNEAEKQNLQGLETLVLQRETKLGLREFTGTVIADQKASLSAQLTAKVAESLVDPGDTVTFGDVLMRLESDDLDARVMQTEQGLSSAQAQLNAARKEYQRVSELVDKKLLPQSEYDRVESQLKTASANFKQTQAAVKEAETTFGFSIITAPFDGVITSRAINQGDTASPGMLLVSLYNPKTLQLEVNISESLINHVKIGSQLNYQLPTFNLSGVGEVLEIVPAADTTSRSFLVKLAVEETDQIYPGVYGKITVTSDNRSVLILPQEALYQVGQLDYVKVVENGRIQTRLVQLAYGNEVRKGLKAGDTVILNPLQQK